MKLNLHLFLGHSVTVYKDSHVTTGSASPNSSVDEETEVALTVTPASGYELDEIEVLAGTVTIDPESLKFDMPDADVVLYIKSKADNLYKVTEECMASVNDTKVVLHKNTVLKLTPNGVPYEVESSGTAVTLTAAVQNLIDTGVLVKI